MYKIELPIKNEVERKWVIYGNWAFHEQCMQVCHQALLDYLKNKNSDQSTEEKSNK